MSKLNCPCGAQLSSVMFPNQYIGYLMSQKAVNSDDREFFRTDEIVDFPEVWECYKCGRLAIDHQAGNVKWYFPDNGIPGLLFQYSKVAHKDR